MEKYIFLDIDGVIATPESVNHGMWGLVDSKQQLLGKILKETGASIVLSSSWRKSTVEETKEYMTEHGFLFSDKIIGVTIRAYHYVKNIHLSIPRGVEIKQWIDANVMIKEGVGYRYLNKGVDYTYVILDDDTDFLLEQIDNFIWCDSTDGLTEDKTNKAIAILNGNN